MIRLILPDQSLENHSEMGLSGGKKTSYGDIALIPMTDGGGGGEYWLDSICIARGINGPQGLWLNT